LVVVGACNAPTTTYPFDFTDRCLAGDNSNSHQRGFVVVNWEIFRPIYHNIMMDA
jgi:hypothetical protein